MQIAEKAILKTLAYFDLFSYPLTSTEIYNYLNQFEITEIKLQNILAGMKGRQIEEKFGYFFLMGRSETVENRRKNLVISELKLKKARKAIRFIRCVPFLRAVFVCNTVASGTADENSDIDFFVITSMGRIWIVRLFTNLILRVFRLRTYGRNSKDKICLSFFVDENNLNLEKLKSQEEDIHFTYWLSQMIPVYDPKNFWKKFVSANYWTKKYLPNLNLNFGYLNVVGTGKFSLLWKKIWELMWLGTYGDLIEKQSKELQMAKFKLSVKEKSKLNDNGVVIGSGVIKLHENDTRVFVYENWIAKLNQLLG